MNENRRNKGGRPRVVTDGKQLTVLLSPAQREIVWRFGQRLDCKNYGDAMRSLIDTVGEMMAAEGL